MSRLEDPWENTPRMFHELCEGHPNYAAEVYALDYANGVRSWMCKSCWMRHWIAAGRPAQARS